jgi:hypothetical protein
MASTFTTTSTAKEIAGQRDDQLKLRLAAVNPRLIPPSSIMGKMHPRKVDLRYFLFLLEKQS